MPRGDKKSLRPVGSKFEVEYPPQLDSNAVDSDKGHVAMFEVVGHVVVGEYPNNDEGVWREIIEMVGYREAEPALQLKDLTNYTPHC